jgi:hypothetical protein
MIALIEKIMQPLVATTKLSLAYMSSAFHNPSNNKINYIKFTYSYQTKRI